MELNKMFRCIKIDKFLFYIILFSFLLKISFWVLLHPWNKQIISEAILINDASEYHFLAKSLIANKSFESFDSFRTPAYPVFLSLFYLTSSNSIAFVLFIQIFLSLISILILYKIVITIFSRETALIASLLFAIDLHQALYTITVLTETLYVFIFLCSIYFFINGIKGSTKSAICFSVFFGGIATLTKPIGIFFSFLIVLFILLFSDKRLKPKFVLSLIFCISFFITISPWLYHNYVKFGEAKLSTISGRKLLFTNVAYAEANKTGKSLEQVRKEFYNIAVKQGIDTTHLNSFPNSKIFTSISK